MTVVTGTVDAVSILRLGHVFVANMTGNVVFLGFALAGASGFSTSSSLVALGAFLAGAAVASRTLRAPDRRDLIRYAAAIETLLAATATIIALTASGTGSRYATVVVLGVAMGTQNAIVRRLAVPDMTTTVLTLTLTGLAADPPRAEVVGRRVSAVVAMGIGAVAGALLVLHGSTAWALGAASILLAVVVVASGLLPDGGTRKRV
jgi:uncharacterized membrane protein YoaK (UPF0700 family)